jgi:hypothetical protein
MLEPLSKNELIILRTLLAGDREILSTLREQIVSSRVVNREFTGVGFFVHIAVGREAPRARYKTSLTINDVGGKVSGVDVGFVLFIKDGSIDCLECHTWGDGEVPVEWQLEEIHYLRFESPGSAMLVRAETRDESALELGGAG